jgi:hypothetical protein
MPTLEGEPAVNKRLTKEIKKQIFKNKNFETKSTLSMIHGCVGHMIEYVYINHIKV